MEGNADDARRAGGRQPHSCESADRDRRRRPHHAALPVGSPSWTKSAARTRKSFAFRAATSASWRAAAPRRLPGRISTPGWARDPAVSAQISKDTDRNVCATGRIQHGNQKLDSSCHRSGQRHRLRRGDRAGAAAGPNDRPGRPVRCRRGGCRKASAYGKHGRRHVCRRHHGRAVSRRCL